MGRLEKCKPTYAENLLQMIAEDVAKKPLARVVEINGNALGGLSIY